MPEFLTLTPPDTALDIFLSQISIKTESEFIQSNQAIGRVTTKSITATQPLPEFPRTTVDGFAVKAKDTFGANEGLPAYLIIKGEVPMGGHSEFQINSGEAALIHTGGMVPGGADAVVMIEYSQQAKEGEVEILRAVAVGENVIRIGEDVKQNQEVIPKGTRLRPAEIGGLMAFGMTKVAVARRPKVGIISSGDEVIQPNQIPQPGQVRDINTYTLSALIEQSGGFPLPYGIVSDHFESMIEIVSKAKSECDIVVITAGSSASTRDLTAVVINQLGKPGVLVHGVNVKPGKPTILALSGQTPMIGLPGNPVSALVIAGLFVKPVIERMLGEKHTRIKPIINAQLGINISSQSGREHWVPVILESKSGYIEAVPIFGSSNLIFTLVQADGLIKIHPDATGLSAGQMVEVHLQ